MARFSGVKIFKNLVFSRIILNSYKYCFAFGGAADGLCCLINIQKKLMNTKRRIKHFLKINLMVFGEIIRIVQAEKLL